jgi:hypothetical protein
MAEQGLTKNQIISELSRSTHGNLADYINVGKKAVKNEPEFFAHLIAWNQIKGQVRDSKVALPIISFAVPDFPEELSENSLAHFATQGPREMLKAFRFAKAVGMKSSKRKKLMKVVAQFLTQKESPWKNWQHFAAQHKHTLKELYVLSHTKPQDARVQSVLFERELPKGSIFEAIANLKNMTSSEAAGTIMEWRIPFIVAQGALGDKIKDGAIVQALIERMSATELVTNTAMLEKLGMKNNPIIRGAYDKALEKAQSSTKNVLKTTRAAENVKDEKVKAQLQGLQDKQLKSMAVEGNWLVLGDMSSSMVTAIDVAKEVAGTLAKMVKGKVWLTFFNTAPQTIDVTGAPLDVIKKATQYIRASGSTSIGCGLQRMLDAKQELDGIAIISDGGDNTAPLFAPTYKKYSAWIGKDVPVYFYQCVGDPPALISHMAADHQDMQIFDLTQKIDFYSIPNLVATMRTNRYSLVDEVMETKLLTLRDVFKEEYHGKREVQLVTSV